MLLIDITYNYVTLYSVKDKPHRLFAQDEQNFSMGPNLAVLGLWPHAPCGCNSDTFSPFLLVTTSYNTCFNDIVLTSAKDEPCQIEMSDSMVKIKHDRNQTTWIIISFK